MASYWFPMKMSGSSQEDISLDLSQGVLKNEEPLPEVYEDKDFRNTIVSSQSESLNTYGVDIKQEQLPNEEIVQSIAAINFNVALAPQRSEAKNTPWVYSSDLKKLFVINNNRIPFEMTCQPPPPIGCKVRAWLEFSSAVYCHEVVSRCPNHIKTSIQSGDAELANYVVRSGDSHSQYETMTTTAGPQHFCVVSDLPVFTTVGSMTKSTLLYYFTCLGPCQGGIERRPMRIYFQLEHGTNVLATTAYEIKICSCPQRDMLNETKRHRGLSSKGPSSSTGKKKAFKRHHSSSDDESSNMVFIVKGAKNGRMMQRAIDTLNFRNGVVVTCCEKRR